MVEIEKYSLPTGNVEYPIDTSELKALYSPELHTDTLVGTDMMYNYTTGQYDAMPVRWSESGMDLVDYVLPQGRAVYAELIANGHRPIRAMVDALTFVTNAMKCSDEDGK